MAADSAALAGDPRFYARSGPHLLSRVAEVAGAAAAEAEGAADGAAAGGEGRWLHGVAPLQTAGPGEVSFLDNRRYLPALEATRAGAVILRAELAERVPAGTAAVAVAEPYAAWARVAALFHPPAPVRPGIHRSAVVAEDAVVDASAEIGPLAVLGRGAEIGAGCRVGPGAVIGAGVVLGPGCRIGALASLSHALLGARVTIHPGARIGQEGFGFAATGEGFLSVPQLGRVILEHDVEVGANATIDRGSVQDTVIGAGSRLDNLVQVGHNLRIGRLCVLVSQVGVSGSTVIEDFVMIGGQAGILGHLHVGRKARIGAQSGVRVSVPAGAEVVGSPAEPKHGFFRQIAILRRLARGGSAARRADGGQAE